jgi:hypothetical protein
MVEMDAMKIPFAGQLTQQQYVHAQYVHQQGSSRARVAERLMLMFVVLVVLISLAVVPSLLRLVFPIILFGIFFVSFRWLSPRIIIATTWRHHKSLQAPMAGSVTPSGISYDASHFKGEVDWTMFLKYKQSPTLVLLYQSPLVFNLFPRSFFRTDEDWNGFLTLVKDRVPIKVEGEGRAQRLQWLVFLGVILIVGLISFVISLITSLR